MHQDRFEVMLPWHLVTKYVNAPGQTSTNIVSDVCGSLLKHIPSQAVTAVMPLIVRHCLRWHACPAATTMLWLAPVSAEASST